MLYRDKEGEEEYLNLIRSEEFIREILEETKRGFVKVLQDVKVKPKTALILEGDIYAHFPFLELSRHIDRAWDSKLKKLNPNPGLLLQEWLIEGGIPTVYYFQNNHYGEINDSISIKNIEKASNWVIYDRHAENINTNSPMYKVDGDAVILHLPFDNFVNDLAENNLIEFSEETFKKSIQRGLLRTISKIDSNLSTPR